MFDLKTAVDVLGKKEVNRIFNEVKGGFVRMLQGAPMTKEQKKADQWLRKNAKFLEERLRHGEWVELRNRLAKVIR